MFLKTGRGSLRSDDSNGSHNNAQKVNFHSFNLYRNIILTRLFFQMQGNSFGVDSLITGTTFKFRKRDNFPFHLLLSLLKRETRHSHVIAGQWQAKNLQKACCVCRVVILSIQPIAFLKFLLPSPSCHLILPNIPPSHKSL